MMSWLLRPLGDRRWDWFLRGTVVVAVAGMLVVVVFPRSIALVWLAVLGIPANSPLSPVLPTMFEPLIMQAAKFASPAAVSLTALGVYMYTEYVNWHLYTWVLSGPRSTWLLRQRLVEKSVHYFSWAPFVSVVVFAFTPLPFWVVRGLAVLRGYRVRPFMLATALGRLPRFFLYAWLGSALRIPTLALLLVMVGGAVVALAVRLLRGERVLAERVLDAPEDGDGEAD
jgi:membrane protein YqaA with SNARE-associated domain